MPCQVANSQTQVQARLPPIPQSLPTTQAQWSQFIATLNQWAQALQVNGHPINVVPAQYSLFQGANLPDLVLSGCTASLDATRLYYGASSLKVVVTQPGATLAFSGFPIIMPPAQKWFCSWQLSTDTAVSGSIVVSTNGGNSVSNAFSVASGQLQIVGTAAKVPATCSPGGFYTPPPNNLTNTALSLLVGTLWQQVWGLFDLRPFPVTKSTWTFTFDQAATFWIDGLQMVVVGDTFTGPIPFGNAQTAGSVDHLPDGATYQRMPGANMDPNRKALVDYSQNGHVGIFDPSSVRFGGKGSTPPSIPDQSFTYTSTTGSVVISWPAMTIYRADGSTLGVSSGSLSITGLAAATTYKVYPYVNDAAGATTVSFSTGGTGVGTPAVAYPAAGDSLAAATMYFRGNLPLNGFQIATTATGTGGGGGGGRACLHPSTPVVSSENREIEAASITPGAMLLGADGPVRVNTVSHRPCASWVRVTLSNGRSCLVTHDHRFQLPDGTESRAEDLCLGMILAGRFSHLEVTGLELVRERADLVSIELDAPHLYYLGCGALCHNPKP